MTPNSHLALEPKDYRNAEGLPEAAREGFRKLYDELCGLCHPTAYSLALLWDQVQSGDTTIVRIKDGDDESRIQRLCHEHSDAISLAMSISVTTSALCLRALNWFSLPEVKCPSIERWNFDDIPAWKKAADRLKRIVNQDQELSERTAQNYLLRLWRISEQSERGHRDRRDVS